MARQRHRKSNSSKSPRVTHEQKLRRLSKAGWRGDPFNKRAVARSYSERFNSAKPNRFNRDKIPAELVRRTDKKTRDDAKAHGFRTTSRGVVVDGPRNRKRDPIKGSRVEIHRGGVVTTRVGARRDFIYGFTRKEKRKFAKNPESFEKEILAKLRKRFPSLAKARKPQSRLQWGAYQATKDFAPSYFTAKYFASISPEETRKVGKKRAKPRIDKLTGFHFVIHVTKKKQTRKKK
jgi:hypothetical protein